MLTPHITGKIKLHSEAARLYLAGDVIVYAQHGRELMGRKSAAGEPKLIPHGSIITASRRQGQTREGMSGGSPSAKPRAYEQKRHTTAWMQDVE